MVGSDGAGVRARLCNQVSVNGDRSTAEQFEFVRALYVAPPPVSRTLPPGDHAVMASSGDAIMLALVADGQACGRFLAPDFIKTMLMQVGDGKAVLLRTPL